MVSLLHRFGAGKAWRSCRWKNVLCDYVSQGDGEVATATCFYTLALKLLKKIFADLRTSSESMQGVRLQAGISTFKGRMESFDGVS